MGTTHLRSEDFNAFGRFYGQAINGVTNMPPAVYLRGTEGDRQGWSTSHNSVPYLLIKIAPIVFIGRKSRPGLSGKSMNSKCR